MIVCERFVSPGSVQRAGSENRLIAMPLCHPGKTRQRSRRAPGRGGSRNVVVGQSSANSQVQSLAPRTATNPSPRANRLGTSSSFLGRAFLRTSECNSMNRLCVALRDRKFTPTVRYLLLSHVDQQTAKIKSCTGGTYLDAIHLPRPECQFRPAPVNATVGCANP